MKFGVVIFPGSNCDQDMVAALRFGLKAEVVELWHKDQDLQGVDMVVLPGGFSYGDYLRSGAIARFSPVMAEVERHAGRGGYVLGVCNGFQILTEAHLLPGALLRNESRRFQCENRHITPATQDSALTHGLAPGQVLQIPIAHAEGRYYTTEAELDALEANDQVLFRYCNAAGQIGEEHTPNGSARAIAGICNAGRNVFGMMPHPERAVSKQMGNTDGLLILEALAGLTIRN